MNERKRLLDFGGNTSEIVAGTTIVVPPNLDYAKPLDFYTQVSSVVFQSMASIAAFFNIAKTNAMFQAYVGFFSLVWFITACIHFSLASLVRLLERCLCLRLNLSQLFNSSARQRTQRAEGAYQ